MIADQANYTDLINQFLASLSAQQGNRPPVGFVPSGGGGGVPVPPGANMGGTSSTSTLPPEALQGPISKPPAPVAPTAPTASPFASNPGFNSQYPNALWGGTDNVTAQKPPDWMVQMVQQYNAMPDGPDKIARYAHIMSFQYPDYLKAYLTQSMGGGTG